MRRITLSAAAVLSLVNTLNAGDGFTLISDPKFNGEIRGRYESVDVEDSGLKEANAYTVRGTVGLDVKLLGVDGLSMKADVTTVQTIGGTKYNDLSPQKFTDYETVADPEQTRFTQAYLQYKLGATTLKAGRQITNLDNQRFIGSVDWRQMPQSLDAVSLTNTSIAGLTLYGAYIDSYATVFKEPVWDSKSVILNASYKVNDMVKITAYDYMLSLEKNQFAADTYGISLTGDLPTGSAKISYHGEYAKQGDSTFDTTLTNIEAQNNASYYNVEATASMMGISVGIGQELLSGTNGSDGKTKFQTPLATLHKFNGTADKFLTTPDRGLVDTYFSLGYNAAELGNLLATYHEYETDVNVGATSDLGSELDLQYTNAIPGIKGLNGLLKAAYYSGGDVNTGVTSNYTKDITKVWVQLGYKF